MAKAPHNRSALVQAIARVLGEHSDVTAAYLYGSVARHTATPLSDVDVAVLLREGITDPGRGELQRRFIDLLGRAVPRMAVEVRF